MLKPYFVELRVNAVVMAESVIDAMAVAECEARDIVSDCDMDAEDAVEVKSLEHLARLDHKWDGECIPYNGDGNTRLKDILIVEPDSFKDTKTVDMFD